MNEEDKKLAFEAAEKLRLLDVILYESHSSRPNDLPSEDEFEYGLMNKLAVEYSIQSTSKESPVLVVKVKLGVRIVSPSTEEDLQTIFSQIEADYLVLYEVLGEVEDDCFKAFSEFNGVHNAWPFWRQHVFDIVGRSRLPSIEIPLMIGTDR